MFATLHELKGQESLSVGDLDGTRVSSLHRIEAVSGSSASRTEVCSPASVGCFVFQDLSVRREGTFRLQFSLYEQQRCTLSVSGVGCPLTNTGAVTGWFGHLSSRQYQGHFKVSRPEANPEDFLESADWR